MRSVSHEEDAMCHMGQTPEVYQYVCHQRNKADLILVLHSLHCCLGDAIQVSKGLLREQQLACSLQCLCLLPCDNLQQEQSKLSLLLLRSLCMNLGAFH